MNFSNRTFAPLLFLLTTALTIGIPCAAMSEELSSGEYFETLSWSQEQDFQRPNARAGNVRRRGVGEVATADRSPPRC